MTTTKILCPLLANFRIEFPERIMSTASRNGKTYVKMLPKSNEAYGTMSWKLKAIEYTLFWDWYNTVLNRGEKLFTAKLNTAWGLYEYDCRFLPGSLIEETRNTPVYEITMNVLVYNYGAPSYDVPGFSEYPQYYTNLAREYLDIIINQNIEAVNG